jgi:hypothetical protein
VNILVPPLPASSARTTPLLGMISPPGPTWGFLLLDWHFVLRILWLLCRRSNVLSPSDPSSGPLHLMPQLGHCLLSLMISPPAIIAPTLLKNSCSLNRSLTRAHFYAHIMSLYAALPPLRIPVTSTLMVPLQVMTLSHIQFCGGLLVWMFCAKRIL